MRLRTLILIALGIFIGYKLAAKMREDDPSVVKGPQRRQEGFGQSRTARTVSTQAQRIAGQATTAVASCSKARPPIWSRRSRR